MDVAGSPCCNQWPALLAFAGRRPLQWNRSASLARGRMPDVGAEGSPRSTKRELLSIAIPVLLRSGC